MSRIIDPHLHFFNLSEGQYTWLQGDNPPPWPNLDKIKAPITLAELEAACPYQLAGLVHIEAGFDNQNPSKELAWLSKQCGQFNYRAVSYSAIDAAPEQFAAAINALAHPALIGIRDITEGKGGQRLLNPYCLDNLALLAEQGIIFEAQFNTEYLEFSRQVINYCQALPHLKLVINHCGLPKQYSLWQQAIALLAQCDNIFIKFSGHELLSFDCKQTDVFNTILHHFGEYRVMFASNFPVCQISHSYNQVWRHFHTLTQSPQQWQKLSHDNAKAFYQLN